jgi:hypothetical protein
MNNIKIISLTLFFKEYSLGGIDRIFFIFRQIKKQWHFTAL